MSTTIKLDREKITILSAGNGVSIEITDSIDFTSGGEDVELFVTEITISKPSGVKGMRNNTQSFYLTTKR